MHKIVFSFYGQCHSNKCFLFFIGCLVLMQKKSELLVPLIMILTVFIASVTIAMIGLILSYFIADVTSNNGIILRLTYENIVIPFPSSLAICFGGKKSTYSFHHSFFYRKQKCNLILFSRLILL